MTLLLFLASVTYLVLAIANLTTPIPFEVFLWGGLILILGWWGHDAIHNRKAAA